MERLSDYIGSPVIDCISGRQFGYMKDAVYREGKIEGIVVQKRSVLTKDCYIPYSSIQQLGDDGVRADCTACKIITWRNNDKIHYLYNTEIGAIGEGGKQVGKISDICFEKEGGEVTGLELNQGIRSDLKHGRKILRNFVLDVNENGEYEAYIKGGE